MHAHALLFLISKVPNEKRAGLEVQTHMCSPQAPRNQLCNSKWVP